MLSEYNDKKYLLDLIEQYERNFLGLYNNNYIEQSEIIRKFNNFIRTNANCFCRDNNYGHITGSAFIVNQEFTKGLFTYHAKLHKWLQLGGHADGENIIQDVAFREACEESGIGDFDFIDILNFPSAATLENYKKMIPFDLDIHLIPERKMEPAHYHFDVRFILVAKQKEFKISSESLDLKWIDLEEVCNFSSDESTLRQVYKFQYLKNNFNTIFL